MSITGQISLKILGENLDFKKINTNLGIFPTRTFLKGKTYGVVRIPAENDSWYYILEFKDSSIEEVLKKLLFQLMPAKEYIRSLTLKDYVSIRCGIQTPLAQIFLYISPEVLSLISELNIGFEISIFSWGGVESEDGIKSAMDLLDGENG